MNNDLHIKQFSNYYFLNGNTHFLHFLNSLNPSISDMYAFYALLLQYSYPEIVVLVSQISMS